MTGKIKQAILTILERKKRDGDVLPYATSIEVAHLLHMNAVEVESLAQDIEGVEKGRTINHEWYDIEHRDIQEVSSEQETESEG